MRNTYSNFVRYELPVFSTQDLRELEHMTNNLHKELYRTTRTTDVLYTYARLSAIRAEILIRDCLLNDPSSDELIALKDTMLDDFQIREAIDIVLLRRGIL